MRASAPLSAQPASLPDLPAEGGEREGAGTHRAPPSALAQGSKLNSSSRQNAGHHLGFVVSSVLSCGRGQLIGRRQLAPVLLELPLQRLPMLCFQNKQRTLMLRPARTATKESGQGRRSRAAIGREHFSLIVPETHTQLERWHQNHMALQMHSRCEFERRLMPLLRRYLVLPFHEQLPMLRCQHLRTLFSCSKHTTRGSATVVRGSNAMGQRPPAEPLPSAATTLACQRDRHSCCCFLRSDAAASACAANSSLASRIAVP